MSILTGKIIVTFIAVGCLVGAAFLPEVKTELIAASVGLLAWAHMPWPGEARRNKMAGARAEAALRSVNLTSVAPLPPVPMPKNLGGPE